MNLPEGPPFPYLCSAKLHGFANVTIWRALGLAASRELAIWSEKAVMEIDDVLAKEEGERAASAGRYLAPRL